jgi:hypothetical protein
VTLAIGVTQPVARGSGTWRTLFQPSKHLADTMVVPEIFSNLRKEITRRKPEWLFEVMPYLYITAGFATLYLIHHAIIVK